MMMPEMMVPFDDFNEEALYAPLLSDDIWKKFQFDFPELYHFTMQQVINEIDAGTRTDWGFFPMGDLGTDWGQWGLFPTLDLGKIQIQNHDCMWAGHCASKEHPVEEQPRFSMDCFMTFTPLPTFLKQVYKQPVSCQQSLLKPTVKAAPTGPFIQTPQTPPMSDDEEVKGKQHINVLQILKEAISECDLDDRDLYDYFEDDELDADVTVEIEKEPEDVKPNLASLQYATESDHSYYKDKNASMRTANLGIDTPSDSEEEIDVVSVGGEKILLNNRMVSSLPNNPSIRDRRQIQRRMATAIKTNQSSSGIKTILPVRKSAISDTATAKRKATECRGIKRSRQYRIAPTKNTTYKRRNTCGNSSESEPEPSEKRNLHNNMERQRRIDLRRAFEDLRQLVPEVSKKERAAKVVILREAAQYCRSLRSTELKKENEFKEQKKRQERLRRQVSQLRRSLAAMW